MTPSDDETTPARPISERARRTRGIVSAVWLVPIVAVVIALGIAWQSWQDRGVLIAVSFPDASGVTAGTTTLRYRELTVGVVEDVGFTADLSRVNVYIRVNKAIAPYLDGDASFWVVQPEVSARGVQGLNTILSGTYIQGTWDNRIGEPLTSFEGDERAPIIPPGVEGTAIVLRAKDSSRLSSGAPILYRGIEVGEVADPRLSPDGTEVRVDAFVRAPYDRQLSTSTRFWDSSGVSATLGTGGVDLRIGSIASILEGGVNFDTLVSGGQAIRSGHVYSIFDDEDSARASTFEVPSNRTVRISALFPTAASGLSQGAPVRFQGVRVGTVAQITGFVRPEDPEAKVELLAVMALQPARMGLETYGNDLEAIDYIEGLVAEGLRAQLVSTSILGGDLAVDLVDDPEAPEGGALEIGVTANPLIPTVPTDIQGLSASAESVLDRINELPIEELLASATSLLDNVNRIAADESTRAIPAEVLALLGDGRGLVRDGRSIIASPQVASVLLDIETITSDLRDLTQAIAARDVATKVDAALVAATEAAENIAEGTANLDALAGSAQVALDGAGALLASEDTQALPGLARSTLEGASTALNAPEVQAILADAAAAAASLRALVAPFDGTALASTVDRALASVDAAAANVAAGTADLETLRARIDGAVAGAEALLASEDTQALPGLARSTLDGASAALNAPELQAILADTAAATASIRALVAPFDGTALAQTVERALSAIDTTAANVAAGTADLETLRAQIDGVVAGAEALVASVDTQALPAAARDLIDEGRDLIASPEIARILSDLARTTADVREITATLAANEAGVRLTTALDAAAAAAQSVAAGAADLPSLSQSASRVLSEAEVLAQNLNALTTKANDLALDALVDATTDLMVTADAFLSSDEAGDVPVVLANTLEELRVTVETIRTGGTLDNLNSTLRSAAGAADSIRSAAGSLPELLGRLRTLTGQAGELLATYGDGSRVNTELFAALRAAIRAAEDVSSLSRTIERNPNSLILGR